MTHLHCPLVTQVLRTRPGTREEEETVEPRRSEDRTIVITPPESEFVQKLGKNEKCLHS